MKFHLLRHATSFLYIDDKNILIDPMLAPKDSLGAVSFNPNIKNPMVELPLTIDKINELTNIVLNTHQHFDHFDNEATKVLRKDIPIIIPEYIDRIINSNFDKVIILDKDTYNLGKIKIKKVEGQHAHNLELLTQNDKDYGYIIEFKNKVIYITGDCVFDNVMKKNITKYKPNYIIANSGGVFIENQYRTLSLEEIIQLSKFILPKSKIFLIHLESISLATLKRKEIKDFLKENNITNVIVPNDDQIINL